ncbi:impB/mucB/samB family protein [Durotheca rogersii]|uniref:impB/mucB/samB family protein n=1 Tax=Durotheca rogersii TaxID=419775 RepID=UPI0022209818|nr:impB/mucB/samB family protein [Durotheca rogersii]KAI5861763.1 impB/mucB/samB family protein [Durotheca rogersii]
MANRLDTNSNAVRKRIESHSFSDETGEEYEPSAFGGFGDYFRRKKIKLQNLDSELRASSTDKPQIFKGVVAHIMGYTQPPLHVLHRDLVQHGAGFLQYLDSKTMATHIIASSLPPKKMVDFGKYRIVKPAWVVDSIQAGKLLPWSEYRVIEETPRQKTLRLDGSSISTQKNTQKSPLAGYREQTQSSFYTSQFKNATPPFVERNPAQDNSPSQSRWFLRNTDAIEAETTEQPPAPSLIFREPRETPDIPNKSDMSSKSTIDPIEAPLDRPIDRLHPEDADEIGEEARPGSSVEQGKPMTSEEHNALLLQDPRNRKTSTANPGFIQQYYSESRLHHLSTWKAELKSRMQKLAAEKGSERKPTKRKPGARRYIMHVDFDSFFCAVSLKSAPEFVKKPAVVAHGTGTGSEIASCNYPAREFGVKNGMWMKRAKELCPELKVLPYDFPAYEEASKLFYESILEVGGVVQSVSIDEALIDVTSIVLSAAGSDGSGVEEGSIWREQEKANQMASSLRDQVKKRTGCAVSVGIGGNILLAKVALRKAKPAGQYQIKPEDVLSFLGELKVDSLPGVAYSIAGKLEEIGVSYVNDVRQTSKERLVTLLGPKTGEKLWEYARGIDRAEVGEQPIRKSVSAEVNWGIRFISQDEAEEFVLNLCKELEKRLLNEQVKGSQLTMKIMRRSVDAPLDPPKHLGHGKCDTFNKSVTFGVATHDFQVLGKEAVSILRSYKFSPGDLRGLGVQLTKLEPIKASLSGAEGSQKRLSFGAFRTPNSARKSTLEPIQNGDSSDATSARHRRGELGDPITESPLTPRKRKSDVYHPAFAISRASEADSRANTPLNISGTQFIMPSNPDLAVVAELPPDIRSRLMAQGSKASSSRGDDSPAARSRAQSPSANEEEEIPPEVDPEVFNALPEDVKAEVLEAYKPRGNKTTTAPPPPPPPPPPSPPKRRIPSLFARARERPTSGDAGGSRTVQTSLLLPTRQQQLQLQAGGGGGGGDFFPEEDSEIDPAFLAELPEDVRREVLQDQRRRRARKRRRPGEADAAAAAASNGQQQQRRRLRFAVGPRPALVPFPLASPAPDGPPPTSLPAVRDALSAWFRRHRSAGAAPRGGDADALALYLARVVRDERDVDKAVKLVRWLEYLVGDDDDDDDGRSSDASRIGGAGEDEEGESGGGVRGEGKARAEESEAWADVLTRLKQAVQDAVRERGLGPLSM